MRWARRAAVLVVLVVAAVVAVSLLRGADTPPRLPKAEEDGAPRGPVDGTLAPTAGSYVGYRVRETVAGVGLNEAVGRTASVNGTARIAARFIARGRLTLHGAARTVRVALRSRRVAGGIDLVGSTPIRFADYGMEPPSVAGVASVRDHGVLEVRLRLR